MANPISSQLVTGTIGELLVQLRLLQFDVQSAPPLKDSGNDLVALRGFVMRTIQVKTSANGLPRLRGLPLRYHLVALVVLSGEGSCLHLDRSDIYLVPRESLPRTPFARRELEHFLLDQALVDRLFAPR